MSIGLLVVWAVYLTFWGLLHGLAVHVEGKGLRDWLVRMAFMVVAGLVFTALAYA